MTNGKGTAPAIQEKRSVSVEDIDKERQLDVEPQIQQKVRILLKSVGDAPPLQHKEVVIKEGEKLLKVVAFVKKQIQQQQGGKEKKSDVNVIVYLKSSFAPNPEEEIGVLAETFGVIEEGAGEESLVKRRLVLHYALTPAWG